MGNVLRLCLLICLIGAAVYLMPLNASVTEHVHEYAGHKDVFHKDSDGKHHGSFKTWNPQGILVRECVFDHGQLIEEHVYDQYGEPLDSRTENGFLMQSVIPKSLPITLPQVK